MRFQSLFENILKQYSDNNTYVLVSGLHGDEPAGNEAVKFFKNKKNVYIISNINNTGKRRLNGKDLNRHFDSKDSTFIQEKILSQIIELNPKMVIDLHEDDEVDFVYAYCSEDIKEKVKQALQNLNVKLATQAHGDKTDNGVITKGKQPYKKTLEQALRRRGISYCTVETPSSNAEFETRVKQMIKVVECLLQIC